MPKISLGFASLVKVFLGGGWGPLIDSPTRTSPRWWRGHLEKSAMLVTCVDSQNNEHQETTKFAKGEVIPQRAKFQGRRFSKSRAEGGGQVSSKSTLSPLLRDLTKAPQSP